MFKEIVNFIKNNKWYVLLVVGLLGLYFYKFHGELSSNSEKWDHFGSYIGGIFSAVTLLSVLHGMQLERKRFNEQRAEFEKERKEQEERRRKEDFERTFFMMLEQHNETLRFLENKDNGTQNIKGNSSYQVIDKKSIVDNVYSSIFENANGFQELRNLMKDDVDYIDINAYFLNLYRILKFVHKNKEINIDNEYSSLLRSFLSRKMLLILAYHLCGREDDYCDYKLYIKEFAFFEHLDLLEIEKDFVINFVSNPINSQRVISDINFIFKNINIKSHEELMSDVNKCNRYEGDACNFLSNLVFIKSGGSHDDNTIKDFNLYGLNLNSIKNHLFLRIIKDIDKNSFLGNKAAESAYDLYHNFIVNRNIK